MSIYNPLISLANKNYKWYFDTVTSLTSTYPTWDTWWFVNIGSTDTMWVWDWNTSSWVDTWSLQSWDMLKSVYDPTNQEKDIFLEIDSKSNKFTGSNISASVNPAVPYTTYLVDATSGNVTITLPDVTSWDTSEYRIVLEKDTNKVIVTTVWWAQLIWTSAIQYIATVNWQLYLKANGVDWYNIITDTRAYYRVVNIAWAWTTDLSVGCESWVIYNCSPWTWNTRTIIIPDSYADCNWNFAKILLDWEWTVIVKTLSWELIAWLPEQAITSWWFELTCFWDHYGITQDSRPKVQNTSLQLFSLTENSTIVDPASTFYRQTCTTQDDSRYDKITWTLVSSPTITWSNIYGGWVITDEWVPSGIIPAWPIVTYATVKKLSWTADFNFYIAFYKYIGWVETLIATSWVSQTISSSTLSDYFVTATLPETDFWTTWRLIRKIYLNKVWIWTNPVAQYYVEWPNPSYSVISVTAWNISHNILAWIQWWISWERYHITNSQHSIINSSVYNKTTTPTVNDDSWDWYVVWSRWVDTTWDKEYVCTDNTLWAAVWVETTWAWWLTYFTESEILHPTTRESQLQAIWDDSRVDIRFKTKWDWAIVSEYGSVTLWVRWANAVDLQTIVDPANDTRAIWDASVCLWNNNKTVWTWSIAIWADNWSLDMNWVALWVNNRAVNMNSIAMWISNSVTWMSAMANGNQNISSWLWSVAMWTWNNVSADYASWLWINNVANAIKSTAIWYNATTSWIIWKIAEWNWIIDTDWDSQIWKFILRARTTDTTTSYLTTNNDTLAGTNIVWLKNNSSFVFRWQVVARELNTDSQVHTKAWDIMGIARRWIDASTISLVWIPTILIVWEDTWTENRDIDVSVSTTYWWILVSVTWAATTNIQWVASIYTTESIY